MIYGISLWGLRRFLGLGYMNPELLVANSQGDLAWLKLEGFARPRCLVIPLLRMDC